MQPQHDDLSALYCAIVSMRSLTVLEFGCGYSTLVIQEALKENRRWFENLKEKPAVRNSNMFKCFSVDTDAAWIFECQKYCEEGIVTFSHSPCSVTKINGQVCHTYDHIPDVVPDFIYLDGPDPLQVLGTMNGLSWRCKERTPMAADIVLIEPTLLPGTMILVDGRTNNARFLENNLKRNWHVEWLEDKDQTVFYLSEQRLGKVNVIGQDICQ